MFLIFKIIITRSLSFIIFKKFNHLPINLSIYTDHGRVQRPLFVVNGAKLAINSTHIKRLRKKLDKQHSEYCSFSQLLKEGVIEYLDVEEEEAALIAMTPQDVLKREYASTYTHCEIHPAMILGVAASLIPFPDHNQVSFFNL